MIRFSSDFLENFLAVVRKYMQLRGGLTQKDLSEQMNVGISTMSRFLKLKIPLHEIIDGIEEESTETFKRLVKFYKDQKLSDQIPDGAGRPIDSKMKTNATINIGGRRQQMPFGETGTPGVTKTEGTIREKFETLSPRQKAYMNDFLGLDVNDRDLIVDLGDAIFRYFRQRNVEF